MSSARITSWPYVYRVNWYRDGELSWSRRTTKKGADDWAETYRANRDYRLSKGQEWTDGIRIERAPVGEWDVQHVSGMVKVEAAQPGYCHKHPKNLLNCEVCAEEEWCRNVARMPIHR